MPGEIDINEVNNEVHKAVSTQDKKSYSAGFYMFLVNEILQAGCIGSKPLKHSQKESGGFRDVGTHTTAEPLPTCWPLVEHVFHFLAQVCSGCHLIYAERVPHPNCTWSLQQC